MKILSGFYGGAINVRKALYDFEVFKTRRLSVPVVCFGNISTGGTGKTSTVAVAALQLAKTGKKPAILLRGYKRQAAAKKLTALVGPYSFNPSEAGDEAILLYNLVKGAQIPVMVCADRFKAGLEAINKYGCDILLMDDGLQHFALSRDLNIILINATAPFYKDFLLPFGDLRENATALKRAEAIIISHCERAEHGALEELSAEIKKINSAAVVVKSSHQPDLFINAFTGETLPPGAFELKDAVVLSAIGDPESFEDALRKLKINIKQAWRYPDHHYFAREEIIALQNTRLGLPVITTYKDFVRFPPGWRELLKDGVYLLSVKIVFLHDGHTALMSAVNSVFKGQSR